MSEFESDCFLNRKIMAMITGFSLARPQSAASFPLALIDLSVNSSLDLRILLVALEAEQIAQGNLSA